MGTTDKQQAIFNFIKKYMIKNIKSPTYREIGKAFKISSKAVSDHLKALERKGLISIPVDKSSRGLKIKGLKMVSLGDIEEFLIDWTLKAPWWKGERIEEVRAKIMEKFNA